MTYNIHALLFHALRMIIIRYCCNRLSFAAQMESDSLTQLLLMTPFAEVQRA
jgi:hypothetical protein